MFQYFRLPRIPRPFRLSPTQFTWTVPPPAPGLRDSPYLSGPALVSDLSNPCLPNSTPLQPVDAHLCSLAGPTSTAHTISVLTFQNNKGYRVFLSKAHLNQQSVPYLGFLLTPGNSPCRPAWSPTLKPTSSVAYPPLGRGTVPSCTYFRTNNFPTHQPSHP